MRASRAKPWADNVVPAPVSSTRNTSADSHLVGRRHHAKSLGVSQLAADALRERLPDGVQLGRTTLRLERARLGPAWPQALQRVMEELAGVAAAV